MRMLLMLMFAAVLAVPAGDSVPAASFEPADLIVVHKSKRSLVLFREGAIVREYRVALGLDPNGPKEREGDFRTPEGRYRITRRNPQSDFFLSLQISYPNERDVARARREGWAAGGQIMIHGMPNRLKHPPEYYEKRDWTDGCIAVSNSDMVEIWLLTGYDTPIEIYP
ncbi:MAG TPA: L,D-transpeptidase family protein [Steroidobacteraceae bacterium]|nr:L,D-transpeptidase family protein [Steroidobacteraceae bacterium]